MHTFRFLDVTSASVHIILVETSQLYVEHCSSAIKAEQETCVNTAYVILLLSDHDHLQVL